VLASWGRRWPGNRTGPAENGVERFYTRPRPRGYCESMWLIYRSLFRGTIIADLCKVTVPKKTPMGTALSKTQGLFASATAAVLATALCFGATPARAQYNGAPGTKSIDTPSKSGDGNITSDATATGGPGGQGDGAGFSGGDGGTAIGTANAVSFDGDNAVALVTQAGGAGGPGTNGANGGNGVASILDNAASAFTGGPGSTGLAQSATGGNGGFASGGGTPGLAGNAASTLDHTVLPAPADASVGSTATGGNGGSSDTISGQNGGNASSQVDVSADGTIDSVINAMGGQGGDGSGKGNSAGNGGKVLAASASLVAGGAITSSITSQGGAGGNGLKGANGGAGASSLLDDATTARTSGGSTTLSQSATGGNGGFADGGGTPGSAGDAGSFIDNSASAPPASAIATSSATGGAGGSSDTIGGRGGGAAASGVTLTATGAITATVTAQGGQGGDGSGGGKSAGVGGQVIGASAALTSTTGGAFTSTITGGGGNGGGGSGGANGGFGASVSLNNAATVSTTGDLNLNQRANGGNGGAADSGMAGLAGTASSIIDQTVTAAGQNITAMTRADGGNGGDATTGTTTAGGSGTAATTTAATGGGGVSSMATAFGGVGGSSAATPPADGGNATARAIASSTKGAASATTTAVAGRGGTTPIGNIVLMGMNGTASAASNATTSNGALALSGTSASGGSSNTITAAAGSALPGSKLTSARVTLYATTLGDANALASAQAGVSATGLENPGDTLYGTAFGLPSDIKAMNPGPSVTADLLSNTYGAGQDKLLDAGILGANYNGRGEAETYTGTQSFSLAAGPFPSAELWLGFISGIDTFSDNGFVSASITVSANSGGLNYTDTWTFDSAHELDNFLSDETIDIGSITDAALSASLTFNLTANGAGGLGFDLAFSADPKPAPAGVPEPASGVLFLSAIGGWPCPACAAGDRGAPPGPAARRDARQTFHPMGARRGQPLIGAALREHQDPWVPGTGRGRTAAIQPGEAGHPRDPDALSDFLTSRRWGRKRAGTLGKRVPTDRADGARLGPWRHWRTRKINCPRQIGRDPHEVPSSARPGRGPSARRRSEDRGRHHHSRHGKGKADGG
jgi:hypothetical protein